VSELLRKGRLTSVRKDIVKFTSSIKSDEKLLNHVVNVNKTHMIMLMEQGIIDPTEGAKILKALAMLDQGLKLRSDLEDVHVAVEEEVIKAIGPDIGGNLNLAKSRNDQVATAIRMNLRKELLDLFELMVALQEALIQTSGSMEKIIPCYTHLQAAQPITFAHYLLAQFDALERSLKRIEEAYNRVNLCPMGAGALATTSFPISRERVADLLGFSGVLENSLDAVSARDFLLEVMAVLSVMAVDVSRLVEDLIIWSSTEFGTIELPDEFTSTSSIMPQKKNPEILEVIRARTGLVIGGFTATATVLKSLPSAYNLDSQEVTPKLWEAIEITNGSLRMLSELIPNLRVKTDLQNKAEYSFLTSTELANMLVRKYKVPFRTAHKIVGGLVKELIGGEKSLTDTTPELLMKVSKRFLKTPLNVKAEEIREAIEPSSFIESHKARGGPSPKEVKRMLNAKKESLALSKKWLSEKKHQLEEAERSLNALVKSRLIPIKPDSSDHKA